MMKRYLLDLSALYSDHRQKAYIGYRAAWTTVGCLIRTVQDTFGIASDLYVCSEDGIFYPECENVGLIHDGETLRILPKAHVESRKRSNTVSDDEPRKRTAANAQQESSTYEDIESTLLGLPKPKRRRIRKRKSKTIVEEQQPSQPVPSAPIQQPTVDETQNGHVRFPDEESQSSEGKASSGDPELPYRNLNRTMKARVVRAVSPSSLTIQPPSGIPSEHANNGSAEDTHTTDPPARTSNPSLKPRIVRALRPENATVQVKRELLESAHVKAAAAAALQQSCPPQTVQQNTPIIELDSQPAPVPGEEATRDAGTVILAV
uniref:Coilin n=1 Tax=Anopheles coluzzii TaxID=1518534 RepID=A0A6E8WDQ4_ANOCL|nr:uncharacterized protein LOC120956749 [Anopheles coluzzii]